jgi:hypothetical protein
MGLQQYILQESAVDRSGSVILENLLRGPNHAIPNIPQITTREMITVTCWYLWYLRRRRTHGEVVPPAKYCTNSIIGLAANFIKSCLNGTSPVVDKWSKPLSNHVKVNVDASFFDDIKSGAVSAVITLKVCLYLALIHIWSMLNQCRQPKRLLCVMDWNLPRTLDAMQCKSSQTQL